MDDYNELNLYLEDDDETTDVWVYLETPHDTIVLNDVSGNPIYYQGWWTIPFIQYNRNAAAHIEGSKVKYFVTISKDK